MNLRLNSRVLPSAVLLCSVAVTVGLAAVLPLWRDEAYTLATTSGTLLDAGRRAITFELQPPGYFMAFWGWRQISDSVLWARLLSVASVATAAWLTMLLARRVAPSVPGGLAVALVAFHPLSIWAAVEVRPYALALLLSSMLLLTFHRGFLEDVAAPWWKAGFELSAVAALYTQYYLGFLLPAFAVALIALRRWHELKSYLALMVAVVLLALPTFQWAVAQVPAHTPPGGGASALDAAPILARGFRYIVPLPLPTSWRWLGLVGAVPLLVLLWDSRHRGGPEWRRTLMWTGALLVWGLGLAAAVTTRMGLELTSARHTIGLLVPTLLLLLVAAAPARPALRNRVLGAMLVLYLALVAAQYRIPTKPGDGIRVARLLEGVRVGEPIFVFPSENVLVLRRYYNGPGTVVPLPSEPSLVTYDPRTFVLPAETELANLIEPRLSPDCVGWFVIEALDVVYGLDFGRGHLEAHLQGAYQTLWDTVTADGARVLKLERHSCAKIQLP